LNQETEGTSPFAKFYIDSVAMAKHSSPFDEIVGKVAKWQTFFAITAFL
jgi:hypothetical protein